MIVITRYNKVIAYYDTNTQFLFGNVVLIPGNAVKYDDALINIIDTPLPMDIDQYEYYLINGKFVKSGVSAEALQNALSILPSDMFKKTYYSINVINASDVYVGTLHFTLFGGAMHVYGSIDIPAGSAGIRNLHFSSNSHFIAPPASLHFAQILITGSNSFNTVDAILTTDLLFNINSVPAGGGALQVNMIYSILGPEQ